MPPLAGGEDDDEDDAAAAAARFQLLAVQVAEFTVGLLYEAVCT